MQVGTICARNYLSSAVLLGRSLERFEPNWDFTVLVVDASEGEIEEYSRILPDFIWKRPEELNQRNLDLDRMKAYYSVMEYSTSLKAEFLLSLLERDEFAMYIDPDIEIFDSLSFIEDLVDEYEIVLTPHVLSPVPRDGLDTKEEAFLISGQFNLGFISVSRSAKAFLNYWNERLGLFSKADHANGYFTDQRWVDVVPTMFKHFVLKDPGCNVAYWNLHERNLIEVSSPSDALQFLVSGFTLKFFHFSGHSAETPLQISKHAPNTRLRIEKESALARILIERGKRMNDLSIEGEPYRWNTLPDGRSLTPVIRDGLWAISVENYWRGKSLPPSPFGDMDTFKTWLDEPREAGLPRITLVIWEGSPYFQRKYPDPIVANRDEFLAELIGDATFLQFASPDAQEIVARALRQERLSGPGINLLGYLAGEFGMGEYGRRIGDMVLSAGIPLATTSLPAEGYSHRAFTEDSVVGSCYDVNVLVMNADALAGFVNTPQWHAIASKPTVGVWAWELAEMSREMVLTSRHLTEIWCGSTFIRDALLKSGAMCPVLVHPWIAEIPPANWIRRTDLGLPEDRFLFGFSFDGMSVPKRKNPFGLVRAYLDAFDENEGAALIIKSMNMKDSEDWRALKNSIENRQDVQIVEQVWKGFEIQSFYELIDCYVSLHRSEGIGLTLMTAMAAGRPVIATGWSGNTDFMTSKTSMLVPFELVPVGRDAGPYPETYLWAEPNLEAASSFMRKVVEDHRFATQMGAEAQQSICEQFSRAEAARWMSERFSKLLKGYVSP